MSDLTTTEHEHTEPEHGHGSHVATVEADPIANPGLPPHQPRPTDVDPLAERRAERQVATLFALSALLSVGFCFAYFMNPIGFKAREMFGLGLSNVTLGLCLGGALLLMGIGAIQWARKLMSDVEIIEYRHSASSSQEDREETLAMLDEGISESGIARRPLVRNSLLLGAGALGLPAIVALRDIGPLPGNALAHTVWKKGMRVVQDVVGNPMRPEDIEVGQLVNAEPAVFFEKNTDYVGTKLLDAKAKAAVVVVRMDPADITPAPGREKWGVDGILVYSKICTHVGCPISLWEQQTHHMLCPCHQSTFDLADNGKVIFGPAARALPQLPITVDAEGYLTARSDFDEPVGPSYWERG